MAKDKGCPGCGGTKMSKGVCLRCGAETLARQAEAVKSGRTADEIAGHDRRREGEL